MTLKSKSVSVLGKSVFEALLLLIASSVLAMGLLHLAGFRGMNHNYPFASSAELAAGWDAGLAKRDRHAGDMDGRESRMEPARVQIGQPLNVRGAIATMNYTSPAPKSPDIRLEASLIAAQSGYGFRPGEFISNLSVKCSLRNLKTGEKVECYLYETEGKPAYSRCYGGTVKMPREGDYELVLTIAPSAIGSSDKIGADGLGWQKPVVARWKFAFAP